MDQKKKDYYNGIRQRSQGFTIPITHEKAIEIIPEEFDAFLMACVFKADKLYRSEPFSLEVYHYYLNSFNRRFKNPVEVWYNKAALHCKDTITHKYGHFRLIEDSEEGFYGA